MEQVETETKKEKVRAEGEELMKDAIKEFFGVGINAEFMNWTTQPN